MQALNAMPRKTRSSPVVAALLLASITMAACENVPPAVEDPKARLAKAEGMFQERCKKAGEFTYCTGENVEGAYLMKLRPKEVDYGDQYRMDDPYGSDLGGDGYILAFVRGSYQAQTKGALYPGSPPRVGYRYVEGVDRRDCVRYRYTGGVKEVTKTSSLLVGGDGRTFKVNEFALDRIPALGAAPCHGVTYDDIYTREDRDYRIAGSSFRVVDLQSGEVIAERVGYMMDLDRGQGLRTWRKSAG